MAQNYILSILCFYLDNLEKLKVKYDISVYKLVNIAIHRALDEFDKEAK